MDIGGGLDTRLVRLRDALILAGVVRGSRDKSVADVTGYALGSVRSILSGHAPLTDRFIKAVCAKFNISLEWISTGKEPMLVRPEEQPYPGGGYSEQVSKIAIAQAVARPSIAGVPRIAGGNLVGATTRPIAGADLPEIKIQTTAPHIAGKPYVPKIAGPSVTDVQAIAGRSYAIAGRTVSIHDIVEKIKQYFIECGEEEYLGVFAASAFLSVMSLPDHEMIDLVYQFRKLHDGDSDQLATAGADEKFKLYSIKPTTRIKLERIPVEPKEEKQEK